MLPKTLCKTTDFSAQRYSALQRSRPLLVMKYIQHFSFISFQIWMVPSSPDNTPWDLCSVPSSLPFWLHLQPHHLFTPLFLLISSRNTVASGPLHWRFHLSEEQYILPLESTQLTHLPPFLNAANPDRLTKNCNFSLLPPLSLNCFILFFHNTYHLLTNRRLS